MADLRAIAKIEIRFSVIILVGISLSLDVEAATGGVL